jgi:serralysin
LLTGGAGADVFVYSAVADSAAGNTRDLIQDFTRSEGDRIDLRGIDANTLLGGVQGFSFIGTTPFSGAGQLRISGLWVAGDVDGDGLADFEIRVLGEASMQAGDFLL